MSSLNNPLDNSENLQVVSKKDEYLASRTGEESELDSMIKYMKYLELKAKLSSSADLKISVAGQDIQVSEMLPRNTEFDNYREKVLLMLNRLTSDHPLYQQLARDFGTNSIFELSGLIANFYLTTARSERVVALIDGSYDNNKDVFKSLAGLGDNADADRKAALDALAQGKVKRNNIKGSRAI